MKNIDFLRGAAGFLLLLFCLQVNAQLPELKINNKTDPAVYLSQLSIDVKVVGNRAITNMTMVFKNKTNRILEGELIFPLPQGVSVSRYALDINGHLREAVPVEKEKATQVFEEIERRRVDPGILERVEGNNFRTRIYPVPAHGSRKVAIGYEEELAIKNQRASTYHLALNHKKAIDRFELNVLVVSGMKPVIDEKPDEELEFTDWHHHYSASIVKENYKPGKPLSLSFPRAIDAPEVMMQKAGEKYYFLVNSHFSKQSRPRKIPDNIAVIWDVSLSGLWRNIDKELELLEQFIRQKKNLHISLYLLNNSFRNGGEFEITGSDWAELKKTIEKLTYDGGTDFSKIQFTKADEYLLFSEGMSTLGFNEFGNALKPVHTIASSAGADFSYLQFIANKTGGNFINLNSLKTSDALKLLAQESLQYLGIKTNEHVSETYPSISVPVINNFSMAGICAEPKTSVTLLFGYGKTVAFEKTVALDFSKQDAGAINLARAWAQKKIAELDVHYNNNKDLITFLGKQFSIVTRNTSLIVLETVNDYVRYEIQPPAELREEFDLIMKRTVVRRQEQQNLAMSNAVNYLNELGRWWDKNYVPAKATPALQPDSAKRETGSRQQVREVAPRVSTNLDTVVVTGYGMQRKRDVTASTENISLNEVTVTRQLQGRVAGIAIRGSARVRNRTAQADEREGRDTDKDLGTDQSATLSTINVKQWTPNRSYLKEIAREDRSSQYGAYLRLREKYINTPTFYFDVAQFFFQQKDTVVGLQVLTNLAEIDIENHELYKLLGFKLRESGQFDEAVFIFKKVLNWRQLEPQSYRDYGLALADAGKYQQAVDTFYTALKKNYAESVAGQYVGFEEILVTEMNRIIALHKNEIDLSAFDKKLIHAMPVDVRVVLSWNKNDTDMDLWVVDPNGEKCYYSNKQTLIGGRMSRDLQRGYGPEQFLLKKAVPGNYQVLVNYYGEQRVKLTGPATVMAEIYTNYAGGREDRKIITLQMEKINRTDGVMVGEFAFTGQ